MKVLLILTFGIVFLFSQSFAQTHTIPLEGPPETSIAWSQDSSEIAIGTDQGIFFVNTKDGKITDRFTLEEFGDDSPHYILQIDWSPDGTKLAIVGKPEITVHYPTDVWIIDRNSRIARKATNSTLYSMITEDAETVTVRSVYYNRAKWLPDGSILLVYVETVDRIESKTVPGGVNSQYFNTICSLDPETEELNDFEGVLPITETPMTCETAKSIICYPDNLYESLFAPDCQKFVIKIPQLGDFYVFILKDSPIH